MNKDTVILKHQQEETNNLEHELSELSISNEKQELKLKELQSKLEKYEPNKKQLKKEVANSSSKYTIKKKVTFLRESSYDELYETAKKSLEKRGMDPDSLDYVDLISEEEINQIIKELNKSLPKEYIWNKADFIVVFVAALLGSIVDVVLSDRNNEITGQQSKFSDWLNRTFHEGKHATNAPIDYQGKGFGGGYHRELSKGHDIIRFVEGIKSFKNGEFRAVRYIDGVPHNVIIKENQFGNPYQELTVIEAIIRYAEHMFADLFSKVSLPFPGYSFLRESDNRNLRKLSADMYHNGFNCKNIIIQSISTIIIEVVIRLYFSVISVKKYNNSFELNEDYSNFEAIKRFLKPAEQEKLHEMLLVAHAIVMGINVGKVVINKNLAEINITEVVAVIKYGISVVSAYRKRNSDLNKLLYHANNIDELWDEINIDLAKNFDEEYDGKLIIS